MVLRWLSISRDCRDLVHAACRVNAECVPFRCCVPARVRDRLQIAAKSTRGRRPEALKRRPRARSCTVVFHRSCSHRVRAAQLGCTARTSASRRASLFEQKDGDGSRVLSARFTSRRRPAHASKRRARRRRRSPTCRRVGARAHGAYEPTLALSSGHAAESAGRRQRRFASSVPTAYSVFIIDSSRPPSPIRKVNGNGSSRGAFVKVAAAVPNPSGSTE